MGKKSKYLFLPLLILVSCGQNQEFKRIQSLEKKGEIYKAWEKYQGFAAAHPKSELAPKALFLAGELAYRHLNDCQVAAAFYDQVIERYPNADPWSKLSVLKKGNCPDYFPMVPGAKWVEGDSDTGGGNARIEIVCKPVNTQGDSSLLSVVFQKTFYGGTTKFQTSDIPYKKIEGELHEFPVPGDPRPKIILKWPLKIGTAWKTRVADRIFSYQILGVDKTILVRAGEFRNCLLVESKIEGVQGATHEYYAPGVGRVLVLMVTAEGEKRKTELLSFVSASDEEPQSP